MANDDSTAILRSNARRLAEPFFNSTYVCIVIDEKVIAARRNAHGTRRFFCNGFTIGPAVEE